MSAPGKMLGEILGHVFKKADTTLYPFEKPEMPANFRGRIKFIAEKCIGCKICMKVCPAYAIDIKTIGEKKYQCDIWLDRCIFCAQCVESCPKDALDNSSEYELAALDKKSLFTEQK
ncbi:MAG: 4Fe-4S binding protein [Spirochaetes bacterium]|nr:4Fe-4S binding protein [Spirochaetota bacterium]